VRVVLPEGARAEAWRLPFPVDAEARDTKRSYLDTVGRTVIVLTKRNVVAEHGAPLVVEYDFPALALLRKPALLASGFAAVFAAALLFSRSEFTLAKDERWRARQARQAVAAALAALRSGPIEALAAALGRLLGLSAALRSAAQLDALAAQRAEAEAAARAADAAARAVLPAVEALDARRAAAVAALLERGRDVATRATKLCADKADLLRRGTPYLEITKKLAPAAEAAEEARASWARAADAACDM